MEPVRKKMRLSGWNYSGEGTYFLTICAKNRKPVFSRIVGRGILDAPEVQLSRYGQCVQDSLRYLADTHDDIIMHRWVDMPNHVHILLTIPQDVTASGGASGMPRPTNAVIAKLVSSLKRFTNRKCGTDLWQTSYYDHIVRDETDFIRRWQYIENNPAAWLEDDYFVD